MLMIGFRILILSILFATSALSSAQLLDVSRGEEQVFLPADYSESVAHPLLILLHGYGTDTDTAEEIWGFIDSVDAFGYVYATPSGSLDESGSFFWNSNTACCNLYNSSIDDVSYLYEFIEELKSSYNIDANRIYVVGDSNGGFMALELAYRFPELLAAAVSSAGASHAEERSAPKAGVHVLQIQGTDDTSILYGGGFIQDKPYPGAEATALQWAAYNNCAIDGVFAENRDLDPEIPGAETEVTVFAQGCREDASVELWSIQAGGHGLGRPVPESSKLQLLDWLFAKSKSGWPAAYSGVIPPSGLSLGINNIGVFNQRDGIIYSCFALFNNGEITVIDGISRFDVGFLIADAEAGTIALAKYRPFNPDSALNRNSELPDCSGAFDLNTGIYTDFVQAGNAVYDLRFRLLSSESASFELLSAEVIDY